LRAHTSATHFPYTTFFRSQTGVAREHADFNAVSGTHQLQQKRHQLALHGRNLQTGIRSPGRALAVGARHWRFAQSRTHDIIQQRPGYHRVFRHQAHPSAVASFGSCIIMRQTRKIVQISDLHLRADAAAVLHGWRVEAAWQRVRRDAQEKHPDADAWILSGDLVYDETVTGYQRLDAQLATLERPVLALAGNHDDPAAMRRHLHHAHVHECIQLGAWHLFALDSHVDGRDAGRIGQAAIAWLDDALHRTPGP